MAIQVLEYHHGLEPQSVWRMVNSNQFAPVAMPEKSIPYVQELGDFYASSSFYTKRHSLVSYLLKYTVSGRGRSGIRRQPLYPARRRRVLDRLPEAAVLLYSARHWPLARALDALLGRSVCAVLRAVHAAEQGLARRLGLRATRRCSRSSRGFWPPIPSRAPTSCVTFRPPARSPAF